MSSISNIYNLRVGNGFDVHSFTENRPLVLGGITIDYHLGLKGHSDADVLIHAIIDSILSPANLPDIGVLFPDDDESYKDIDSTILLNKVYRLIREKGIQIINIDSTIICEKPKLSPYIDKMKEKISETFFSEVSIEQIGIKATTSEKLGFTGRGEGIAVYASSLISI